MKKPGLRRLYAGIHKTSRQRKSRIAELQPCASSKEVQGWRKCTTLKPLDD